MNEQYFNLKQILFQVCNFNFRLKVPLNIHQLLEMYPLRFQMRNLIISPQPAERV